MKKHVIPIALFIVSLCTYGLLIFVINSYDRNPYDKSALRDFIRVENSNEYSPFYQSYPIDIFYINSNVELIEAIDKVHKDTNEKFNKGFNSVDEYNDYAQSFGIPSYKCSSYVRDYIEYYKASTALYIVIKSETEDSNLIEFSKDYYINQLHNLMTRNNTMSKTIIKHFDIIVSLLLFLYSYLLTMSVLLFWNNVSKTVGKNI